MCYLIHSGVPDLAQALACSRPPWHACEVTFPHVLKYQLLEENPSLRRKLSLIPIRPLFHFSNPSPPPSSVFRWWAHPGNSEGTVNTLSSSWWAFLHFLSFLPIHLPLADPSFKAERKTKDWMSQESESSQCGCWLTNSCSFHAAVRSRTEQSLSRGPWRPPSEVQGEKQRV